MAEGMLIRRGRASATEPETLSYSASVWRRLARNRLAMFGVWSIVALVTLATFAPVLALNQPFYWDTGSGVELPWLRALFNRLFFENAVDVFFNIILIASLPLGVYLLATRRTSRRSRRRRSWAKFAGRTGLVIGGLFVAVSVESVGSVQNPLHFSERVGQAPRALFPLVPYSYRETDPTQGLQPPNRVHWLGTDTEGRDVFCRMLYGTRISLTIGVVAVAIYVSIGTILGALAGYFGGWVDTVISRLVEMMITFPSFFLILTLAAMIQNRSIFHVMLIIGLTNWTTVARLVRAEFLRQKNLDYVQAALALGLRRRRVIFLHILPNAISPALVAATFGIASAILIESSLSFLGVGDLSVASWGETLSTGRVQQKIWLLLAPGAAIFFVVTIFNLVGEGVRDALDPKFRV
jgi:peptide/nickel transport system permease protein